MLEKQVAERSGKYIFDTVVLSNFLLSKSESILEKRYFSKGAVTSQVITEIEQGIAKGYPLCGLEEFLEKSQFSIVELSPEERQIFTRQLSYLGTGEASCIACAATRSYCVVTDDKKARIACREFNLPVTGTIGILKACCLNNIITQDEADEILSDMMANGFYSPIKSLGFIL